MATVLASPDVTDRLDPLLQLHPFTRLAGLLKDIAPGGPLVQLAVGEPQRQPPAFVAEIIARHAAEWSRYPQAQGTPEFRRAAAAWLARRFRLPSDLIDPDRHLTPVAGTREALFMTALSAVPERREGARPAVLMPNPFYHVYAGAAAVAGGEPVFLPATRETGFLPDPDAIPAETLGRTALAYVCSPANPQGAVASPAYLRRWIELARAHGFVVAFDECYCEIYGEAPPPGALTECAALGDGLAQVLVFHSLSKRSGAAGLRSGFLAGDERLIRRNQQLVNYGGVAPPYPILAASTALWQDEAHVEAGRALYRANFDLAEARLGNRFGWRRPAGGFFVWLEVGDGEAAARTLWARAGIRVLPGGYMARPDRHGRNPGAPYIRVALVQEPDQTAIALDRMAEVLDEAEPLLAAAAG
jgi:aspartate/methionine/tyrosine aminotransferase